MASVASRTKRLTATNSALSTIKIHRLTAPCADADADIASR